MERIGTMSHKKNVSLFEDQRMTMHEAIQTSIASLKAYGSEYRHWSIAFSGGKDSTATVTFIHWLIATGQIDAPETLTVLYADTRQEIPVLNSVAMALLDDISNDDINTKVVLPEIDNRFYVYMLGRGIAPPSNTFRWCTDRIKIKPMLAELEQKHAQHGHKFLQITGVRMGESAARDQRISISCTSNKGECGQGWFQSMGSDAVADTLAPIVHWRTCFVWDWLYLWSNDQFAQKHGYERGHRFEYVGDIAAAYGDGDVRTGCIGCMLASRDVALDNLVQSNPEYIPLLEIRPVLEQLKHASSRIRKANPERTKAGNYAQNGQRMGPLTMEARVWGLEQILDIQERARVDLINREEESRIRELWSLNTWPQGWEGGLDNENHVLAVENIDRITVVGKELVIEPRLI